MQVFNESSQPLISEKYKAQFKDFSLQEIKVPDLKEVVGSIYMFINNINGKIYIGQTITKFYSR